MTKLLFDISVISIISSGLKYENTKISRLFLNADITVS